MLAEIFKRAGYRTGLFTSPHLVDFRERIKVDNSLIPRRAVSGFIDRYRRILVKKNSPFSNSLAPWRSNILLAGRLK